MYLAMSQYFARDNVALPGLAHYFMKESKEEREHAEMLMEYQVMRGGRERWIEIPRNRSTEVLAELAMSEARGAFAWVHTEEEMRAALFDQLADQVDPKQFHVTGGGEAL